MRTSVYVARGSEDGVIGASTNLNRIVDMSEAYLRQSGEITSTNTSDNYNRGNFIGDVRAMWVATMYSDRGASVEVSQFAD